MNEIVIHKMKHNLQRTITSIKWVIFSMLVGLIVGLCGTAFYKGLYIVTQTRIEHPWLIFLLPFAGLLIVGLYHALKNLNDGGTNLVISAIHSGDELCVFSKYRFSIEIPSQDLNTFVNIKPWKFHLKIPPSNLLSMF